MSNSAAFFVIAICNVIAIVFSVLSIRRANRATRASKAAMERAELSRQNILKTIEEARRRGFLT